ncbi:MAG TPA: hypothetical protein VNJ07_08405 [Chitinophagales bacterium]|nr:hypothetical protein [Chitinophagales bacterium]
MNQEISAIKGRIHTDGEFATRDACELAGLPGCVMIVLYILAIVGVVSRGIIGWGVAIAILLVICLIWSSIHKVKQMKNKLLELETERDRLETILKKGEISWSY